jgi:hypothetical protein
VCWGRARRRVLLPAFLLLISMNVRISEYRFMHERVREGERKKVTNICVL